MELISEDTHRVLAYIAGLKRQGYPVAVDEVEAYANRPTRRAARSVSPLDRAFRNFSTLALGLQQFDAESFVEFIVRLRWAKVQKETVVLTQLGYALLREVSSVQIDTEAQSSIEIVLNPDDPFAYSRVIAILSDKSDALLVDPYFKAEQFIDIVQESNISRVLLSKKIGQNEIKKLQFALKAAPVDRIELRIAESLHDRYIIPPDQNAMFLGTSLNGVGKSLSAVGTLGKESSEAIRVAYEDIWNNAVPLLPDESALGSGSISEDGNAATKKSASGSAAKKAGQAGT